MSYMVLARKWRPRTFSQLIGQESLVLALSCSLEKQRLHHAYLFTGTRGVGKTSVARIFAKSLNCEQGISSSPCLKCDICLSIEQGRFVDLLEIDGASRTRVEDTRELLDNVMYAPTYGRFKIYLIDEVHMLSQHSFNALLKTLEEPPEHVKFILATTDPQKLPPTVLSRCLQFNLKHIDQSKIQTHLEFILTQENYKYETDAIKLLAKSAHGSMRDALSLLDQTLAGTEHTVTTQHVKNLLGFTQKDYALEVLQALSVNNPNQLLLLSQEITKEGGQFIYVLEEILTYLHKISLIQQIPSIESNDQIRILSQSISPENIQLFYQIALNGKDEIMRAPTTSIGFEMTLLRMYTFAPEICSAELQQNKPKILESIDNSSVDVMPTKSNSRAQESLTNIHHDYSETDQKHQHTLSNNNAPDTIETTKLQQETWEQIISNLKLQGLALNAAENAELINKNSHQLLLKVAKGHQSLFTTTVIKRIEQSLYDYYNASIKLQLEYDHDIQASPAQQKKINLINQQKQDAQTLQEDPIFQQLKDAFSMEIIPTITK